MTARPDIVAAARRWRGTPYLHQASVRGAGTDCLGLLRGIWREVLGPEPEAVPPYGRGWAEAASPGRPGPLRSAALRHLVPCAPQAAACPGEVLLFRMRDGAVAKHLGILTEAGAAPRFIHAYEGHGVCEAALTRPWARRVAARFAFPQT